MERGDGGRGGGVREGGRGEGRDRGREGEGKRGSKGGAESSSKHRPRPPSSNTIGKKYEKPAVTGALL